MHTFQEQRRKLSTPKVCSKSLNAMSTMKLLITEDKINVFFPLLLGWELPER